MGDYSRIYCNVELREDLPKELVTFLTDLLDKNGPIRPSIDYLELLPENDRKHRLFKTDGWYNCFCGGLTAYFEGRVTPEPFRDKFVIHDDCIDLYLNSHYKAKGSAIQVLFFHWLADYVLPDDQGLAHLGDSEFEYDEYITRWYTFGDKLFFKRSTHPDELTVVNYNPNEPDLFKSIEYYSVLKGGTLKNVITNTIGQGNTSPEEE